MITAEELKDNYISWIRKSYDYSQLDNGVIRIDTPFMDNMSDGIIIYAVQNSDNTLMLTDDGWTLDNLKSHGVFVNKSKPRKKLLEKQLKIYGITLDNNDLMITTELKKFAEAKHRLLQAILFVNDMFIWHKLNRSTFSKIISMTKDIEDREEQNIKCEQEFVRAAVIWPEITQDFLENEDVTVAGLSEEILYNSGFVPPQTERL